MRTLILPLPKDLMVFSGGEGAKHQILERAAKLAEIGPVFVVDRGERQTGTCLEIELAFLAHPAAARERIWMLRARSALELVEALEALQEELHPGAVCLVDFMTAFLDREIPYLEARHQLGRALKALRALSQSRPVLLSMGWIDEERAALCWQVVQNATQVWVEEQHYQK